MKIGILTFHCAHNYGAVLQCYALQKTLMLMGYEVDVIDYRPFFLLSSYDIFNTNRLISKNPIRFVKNCIREILILPKRIKRYYNFDSFIKKKLHLSSLRISIEKYIPDVYDVYIMGSDQIWNPRITKGFHAPYFAFFPFPKRNRRYISYAASMEVDKLNDIDKDYFRRALCNFDMLSVREERSISLLQPLSDRKISLVLDPTLLVKSELWDSIAVKPKIKEKYVVVYQVRTDENTMRIAKDIAQQIGGKVVKLVAFVDYFIRQNDHQCASPEEFLGWIKYSSCVVSTSFHGTAFSIIFNKPFYTLRLEDGWDTRSRSLLENLGLSNRLLLKSATPVFERIDYSDVNRKLEKMRFESKEFLKSSLI